MYYLKFILSINSRKFDVENEIEAKVHNRSMPHLFTFLSYSSTYGSLLKFIKAHRGPFAFSTPTPLGC